MCLHRNRGVDVGDLACDHQCYVVCDAVVCACAMVWADSKHYYAYDLGTHAFPRVVAHRVGRRGVLVWRGKKLPREGLSVAEVGTREWAWKQG